MEGNSGGSQGAGMSCCWQHHALPNTKTISALQGLLCATLDRVTGRSQKSVSDGEGDSEPEQSVGAAQWQLVKNKIRASQAAFEEEPSRQRTELAGLPQGACSTSVGKSPCKSSRRQEAARGRERAGT